MPSDLDSEAPPRHTYLSLAGIDSSYCRPWSTSASSSRWSQPPGKGCKEDITLLVVDITPHQWCLISLTSLSLVISVLCSPHDLWDLPPWPRWVPHYENGYLLPTLSSTPAWNLLFPSWLLEKLLWGYGSKLPPTGISFHSQNDGITTSGCPKVYVSRPRLGHPKGRTKPWTRRPGWGDELVLPCLASPVSRWGQHRI
jgi:hypothetical protein